MEQQIRFLVESYYDIQKLRVETFNRIVAYIKNNPQKFSQKEYETQKISASHKAVETHGVYASREEIENQVVCASQNISENQDIRAVKPSTIAKAIISGKIKPPKEISELIWYHNSLYETEKQLAKRLDEWSKHHPLRIHFLNRIQGIGGVLASGIIAWLSPISRFPNISKLWKYCGLAPGQKRRRGEKVNYHPKLKTFMWKIATSFEKQKPEKSYYRRIYDEKKKYYMEREDLKKAVETGEKGAMLHIRMMTLRYTVKRFLADLWIQWRKLEGLPITKPYPHAILKHTNYQEWQPDKKP
jgi:hypothetical protein